MMSFATASGNRHPWFGTRFSTEMIKPGESVMVKMYYGKKPEDPPPNYFDAHEIENYLGKTIKRD
jgi:hypothetical protein